MGGSESKSVSTNENNQTIVNRNTMNLVNEQINEAVAKTSIDNATGCSSNVDQTQVLDFSGCNVMGDFNISNVKMRQTAVVDLSCVQTSNIENEVAQEIMSEVVGQIQSGLDSESLNAMTAFAEAEASSGFLATGSSDATSITKNKFNLNVVNENQTDIQNIVQNAINVEFDVEDVQTCAGELSQEQAIRARNCAVGGNVNVTNIDMEQGVEALTECVQERGIAQKITNAAASGLGVIIEAETAAQTQVAMEAASTAVAESGGVGDIFSASLDSITGSLSFLPATSAIIVAVICLLCLLSSSAGLAYYMMTSKDQRGAHKQLAKGAWKGQGSTTSTTSEA